ncbi:hypothetical protein A9Q79_08150 [Methylophaga sp. 42_25_T18]|nr:hypothetical protein A9Q79_08150 [Methylophaga sp. 42_25_T18]OUR85439.1 hypothetical protein A9Q92_08100 [Methylophaga sp. 42_8_T64]
MLKLANDLLTHEWQIVEEGKAELSIYSFDSDEGLSAWKQREEGLTALLTVKGNITEPVDIILKKPLRTTNFSEALNIVEDKIAARSQKKSVTPKAEKSKQAKTSSVFSSLSSGLSKYINGKKSPASDLPSLLLQIPDEIATPANTILDVELLKNWLDGLNYSDNNRVVAALLGNLIPLNRLAVANKVRLELLEIYRGAIHKILFARDIAAIKRDLYASTENLKAIKALNLAVEELAIGYKLIVNQLYLSGERPDTNKLFLTAINRTAEQLALQVLHAYQYYRSAPTSALYELHQFYLYCEASNTLDILTEAKDLPSTSSFYSLYTQIILISIAEPFSLDKFNVLRLFNLMKKFTKQVEISLLTDKQKNTTSDFLMTGHFCLNCASDHPPTAMAKTTVDVRKQSQTRLLNTQPVLLAIEDIFKRASQSASRGAFDLDIQLLKKIIPQLNTSYERKYQRLPSIHTRKINIANGIRDIHTCLKENHVNGAIEWSINNQGSGGIMASRNSDGCYDIHIGDFIGVFEQDLPVKLASIRWLNIDNNDSTHIGLELLPGHPTPVFCLADDNTEYPALLLPEDDDIKQPATLIAEKGIFSPKRLLKLKGDEEPYSVSIDKLINHTYNFEQFSFTIIKTK